ncbi:MAG: tetratricopeptide repeat protein, partial [Anaerolineales bacterium]|nr:tetratricopeptide repeat protein [Anaerolineales bacterium]
MTEVEILESRASALLSQPDPPLVELRKTLLEIDEYINSDEYQSLSSDERNRLQHARKEIRSRLQLAGETNNKVSPQAVAAEALDASSAETAPAGTSSANRTAEAAPTYLRQQPKGHDPAAEEQMEEAERLFYSGRYAEAIKLFDRVLQLEPKWERARQHRTEAETYLRTGFIPPVALPAEAASAFGKAQSAARVGRYNDALALLGKAQATLRDVGIQRWQEGMDFEQKLQENVDAEYAYQEGLKFFEQGRLDEAIERVETAARATGLPKYSDKGQEFRRVREIIRAIHETLSALSVEPKAVAQAKADLDLLTAQHGENPALVRLRSRLEAALPRVVAPLKDQVRSLKTQAERAETLEEAVYLAKEAKSGLDQIHNLEGIDESLDRLQNEVNRFIREVEKLEQDLSQAQAAYENQRSWPVNASRLSQEVRQRYPNDPAVIRLSRSLSRYHTTRAFMRLGMILAGIGILALITWWGYGRYQAYQISLIPTATGTATETPTATATPTATKTPTLTPTATATLTP